MSNNTNNTIDVTIQRIPGTPRTVSINKPFTVASALKAAGMSMSTSHEASVGDSTISYSQVFGENTHELDNNDNVYIVAKTKGNDV